MSYDSALFIIRVVGLFVLALYMADPKRIFAITSVLASIVYLACVVHLMVIIGVPWKTLTKVIVMHFLSPAIAATMIVLGHQIGVISDLIALCTFLVAGTLMSIGLIRSRQILSNARRTDSENGDLL